MGTLEKWKGYGDSKMPRIKYARLLIVIMLITFFISIISHEIISKLIQDTDIYNVIMNNRWWGLWWTGEISDVIWISLLIGLGIYHALIGKARVLAIIAAAIGLVMIIGGSFHELAERRTMIQVIHSLNNSSQLIATLGNNESMSKQAPLELRSRFSHQKAELIFRSTGKISTYLKDDGTMTQYVPTSEDLALAKMRDQTNTMLPVISNGLIVRVWLYSIAGFISVVSACVFFLINRRFIRKRQVGEHPY